MPIVASVLLVFALGGYWVARQGAWRSSQHGAVAACPLPLRPQRLRGASGPSVVHVARDVGRVQVPMVVVPGRFAVAAVTVRTPAGNCHVTRLSMQVFDGVHFIQLTLPVRITRVGADQFVQRTVGTAVQYSVFLAPP